MFQIHFAAVSYEPSTRSYDRTATFMNIGTCTCATLQNGLPRDRRMPHGSVRRVSVSCPLTVLGLTGTRASAPVHRGDSLDAGLHAGRAERERRGAATECSCQAGMIILAFLVETGNAVSNMDPVKNDFTLAFDSLNNYIDEVKPPPSLRTTRFVVVRSCFRRITTEAYSNDCRLGYCP